MPVSTFLVFPGTETAPPQPAGPLDVVGAIVSHGVGPRTVLNPAQGLGGTLVLVSVAPSPGIQPSGDYIALPGSPVQQFDYPGENFVQRARVWTLPEAGQATIDIGFSGSSTQSAAIIALDGDATSVAASGFILNTALSTAYPSLATEADMLVLAFATQQQDDDLLSGPSDAIAELINNTATTGNRGLAVHKLRADSSIISPNPATWDGSVGAHVQFCIGFAGTGGTNQPLPAADWTVFVDPTDPDSWNDQRPDGQLIVAGNRFQVGDATDDINAGTGYGLAFHATTQDEIHSFAMEGGGETLRLGPRPITGLQHLTTGLEQNHQFRNSDGYDESQEVNGVNLSTTWPGTDRTYFDGTRTQLSLIPNSAADPKAIQASFGGETGDRVLMSHLFQIEQWMLAADDNVAGGGCHASGSAPSPWSQFIGQGQLRIVTRNQSTPWTTSNNNPTSTTEASVSITGADVGDWWAVVHDFTIDPLDGHLAVWLAKGAGGFTQIVNLTGGYGLSYADSDPLQALWYGLLINLYSWHRFTPGPLNNWDDTYGNRRRLIYAPSGIHVAPPPTITPTRLMSHNNYYLQG